MKAFTYWDSASEEIGAEIEARALACEAGAVADSPDVVVFGAGVPPGVVVLPLTASQSVRLASCAPVERVQFLAAFVERFRRLDDCAGKC